MNDPSEEASMMSQSHERIVPHQEALQRLSNEPPALEESLLTIESRIEDKEQSNRKYKGSFRGQFKALVMKNYSLQKKQIGTNICQLLTPIVCLAMTLFIRDLALSHMNNLYSVTLGVPYLYNVPYNKIYGSQGPFKKNNPLSFDTCLQFYLYDFGSEATQDTIDFVGNNQTGLLSKIFPPVSAAKEEYVCKTAHMEGKYAPFFKRPVNGSINNQTYNNLKFINSANFTGGKESPYTYLLQDGSFTFNKASRDGIDVTLQVNDVKLTQYHRNNGITRYKVRVSPDNMKTVIQANDGQLILLDLVSKAYLSSLYEHKNGGVYMISGSQIMPETVSDFTFIDKVISSTGASLFSIALSLLLPIFMHTIVHEKEERLREIMKMNGLKMKNYWLVNYLWSLGLYLISVTIFIVFGRFVLQTDFFAETDIWILILCMVGWGFSQVSLSFFFQNFLQKAKTALIAGYLLSIWTSVLAVTFSVVIFPYPATFPMSMRLYPPFAFTRLMYNLSYRCSSTTHCVKDFSELSPEMISCIVILYAGALFFLLFGLYLDQVLPQEFGVRKGLFFFLKDCFSNGNGQATKNKKDVKSIHAQPQKNDAAIKIEESNVFEDEDNEEREDEEDSGQEDDDVKRERAYIDNLPEENSRHPLLIKNLRKVYKAVGGKPPKVAVKNLSLHIKKGEVFGLLGPNGAGKTSLISMLTGLYPPESGNAWVGGYDILNNIGAVHTQIGVCPQFDLLWPELTVKEHLEFYARVRGISRKDESAMVTKALKEVYLTRFADFRTRQLSGGMKRRLSVAISLVGNPSVIFLDEPTTGLDPENRRQLWDILVENRGKKAIVLTTHSMEEADVLCTRIGIITNGALRCIGNQTKLKGKYGGGYHLYINCHKDKYFNKHSDLVITRDPSIIAEDCYEKLEKHIKQILPKADLKSSFNGGFIYLVPLEGFEVSKLFEELESKKEELGISDWGISQSTLEDVFMEIVKSYSSKDSCIQ